MSTSPVTLERVFLSQREVVRHENLPRKSALVQAYARQEILDLSTGDINEVMVNWDGQRVALSQVDGVLGLGRLKGVWADRAHNSLLCT